MLILGVTPTSGHTQTRENPILSQGKSHNRLALLQTVNESTTGADGSVEMPKLHNIKLRTNNLHMMKHFFACMQTQRVGNDQP